MVAIPVFELGLCLSLQATGLIIQIVQELDTKHPQLRPSYHMFTQALLLLADARQLISATIGFRTLSCLSMLAWTVPNSVKALLWELDFFL